MGKYSYRVSLPDYKIGETESYYSEMASKGYRLKKRIWFLDQFEKNEPANLEYRIEMTRKPELLEESGMSPDEQKQLYEDAGWIYVTGQNDLSIFVADGDQDVPEIHTGPQLQAETLKNMRSRRMADAISCIVWLILTMLLVMIQPGTGMIRVMAENTACLICIAGIVLLGLYCSLRGFINITKIIRSLKKGNPINHHANWQKGRKVHQFICGMLIGIIVLAGIELIREEYGVKSLELPHSTTDEPYLVLEEVENGVRRLTEEEAADEIVTYPARLREKHTLAAPLIYDVFEQVYPVEGEQTSCWMYQDYYETESPEFAQLLAEDIMQKSIWLGSPEEYQELESDVMDLAVASRLELLVVRDNRVMYITYLGNESMETLLHMLEEKWK